MNMIKKLLAAIVVLASFNIHPVSAQTLVRAPAYVWFYDGRDDDRDFPTNGVFPGDFASNPAGAAFSASGIFGRSTARGRDDASPPAIAYEQHQNVCAQRYRSYDPASGTYVGKDHLRHRC